MKPFALSAALAVAAFLASPPDASACGGFFCSTVPIDQSGEEIIFDVTSTQVEAHVKIMYTGAAADFAWVVPVHGVPTLKPGSPEFFTYVRNQTQPRFNTTWDFGSCGGGGSAANGGGGGSLDAGSSASDSGTGVVVYSQGQVGPYDSAVIGATTSAELSKWLTDNGYNLQDPTALDPYVGGGFNFLALKLQQDKSVGELRPIVIRFGGSVPCIPIRLTAVAAQPDMPINAYVFSSARAVPTNYRHVLLNETRINWATNGANYSDAASRAVDEAGGRAFLTEYAGATTELLRADGLPGAGYDSQALAQLAHPVDFAVAVQSQGFPRGDGALFAMFVKYIPLPKALEGQVTPQQFYSQISSYRSYIDQDPNRMAFDAAGFAHELQTVIVEPLLGAGAIIAKQPYFTRLYTTMSADEMTVDPEFEFNPSAGNVSRDHSARIKVTCDQTFDNQTYEVTLADGTRYVTTASAGGQLLEGPWAAMVEQYTASGAPAPIVDNRGQIAEILSRNKTSSEEGSTPFGLPTSGCGCATSSSSAALPFAALLLAGWAWGSRRRRVRVAACPPALR